MHNITLNIVKAVKKIKTLLPGFCFLRNILLLFSHALIFFHASRQQTRWQAAIRGSKRQEFDPIVIKVIVGHAVHMHVSRSETLKLIILKLIV